MDAAWWSRSRQRRKSDAESIRWFAFRRVEKFTLIGASTLKYYFRLEQCSRHSTGDSQKFPLASEHPYGRSLAEFRQVDSGAVTNPGGALRRRHHRWKLGQHQARMQKKFIQGTAGLGLFQLFQAVCFFDGEFAHCGPFELREMCTRSQLFPQIVRQ